jgi:hypothetical protein
MDTPLDRRIAHMDEHIAVPRKNGELAFAAPWEARAFGMAVALGLAAATTAADHYGRPSSYYERWLAALEKLAIAKGLVTPEEIAAKAAEYTSGASEAHGHHDAHGPHHTPPA